MCQPKNKGGKRCARHMNGSVAAVRTCVVITGIKESEVGQVFTSLRKEGKHLPEPTREEVENYTKSEEYSAKWNPNIPDNKRPALIERWKKAREENPDGGTMHAWRNVLPSTIMQYNVRGAAASTALIGSMLIAGCAPGVQNNNEPPAPSTSPSVSAPATVAPSSSPVATPTEAAKPWADSPVKIKDSLVPNGTAKNEMGTYTKVKYDEKDVPKLKTSEIQDSAKALTSTKELEAGNKKSVKFLTEVLVDSPLGMDNDNYSGYAKHIENTDPKLLSPALKKIMLDKNAEKSVPYFMHDIVDTKTGQKIDAEYVKGGSRLSDVEVIPGAVYEGSPGYVVYDYTLTTVYHAKDKKTGKTITNYGNGVVRVAAPVKDGKVQAITDYEALDYSFYTD